jgi:hypothetical protein
MTMPRAAEAVLVAGLDALKAPQPVEYPAGSKPADRLTDRGE